MNPERIALWYLPVANTGGVLRHALDVAREGFARHKLVFVVPPGRASDELRDAGAPVITAPVGPDSGAPRSIGAISSLVRTLRPSVVHSHLAYADVVLAAASLPKGVRRITTEHGISGKTDLYHSSTARKVLTPRMHALRLQRFAAAIAVSESTANEMKQQWNATLPLTVIYNGIASRVDERRPGRRILSLSRLAPEKRIDSLLEAFSQLYIADPSWTLTVAGDGPLRDDLVAHAHSLGIENSTDFPGFIDADSALSTHDTLVQLSEWENCSYSLLDAAAAGLGAVATDVGGNREILPSRSLTDGSVDDLIIRIQEQADDISARPTLPTTWPSVADMIAAIEDVYEGSRL